MAGRPSSLKLANSAPRFLLLDRIRGRAAECATDAKRPASVIADKIPEKPSSSRTMSVGPAPVFGRCLKRP